MILQKQITTAKVEILVIGGLPEDAKFDGYSSPCHIAFCDDDFLAYHVEVEENSDWEPLGFLKDISEDVAKGIIPYINELVGYMDYARNNNISFDTATEALHSLIQTNCKLKNEYGEVMPELNPICCNILFTDRYGFPECCGMPIPTEESIHLQRLWEEEQSEVFTNPFLLKKV